MKLGFLRSPIVIIALFVLVLGAYTPTVVKAVDSVIDGNLTFTGPGQGGAKDIHTNSTDGGLRIYNGSSLGASPNGAAIQFYGNTSASFPGQAFIDSGANNNAGLIFRTAPTSGAITERMRVTADGKVGIGTSSPQSTLQVIGNYIQIPATLTVPATGDCDAAEEVGRLILYSSLSSPAAAIFACIQTQESPAAFAWSPIIGIDPCLSPSHRSPGLSKPSPMC
jgi:hypothetical protein